ncbi:hypothetical protein [Candidatus Liberibacter africanus]|uniref:Uncharacterized protein n=1 Tax=Candidatus Liberibacter africanus PTSAPSY TaxID=1277257 RepID=A0A0G3I6F6_LIBAF|nr:hypothetical protein [Candidatus Liberibacter africanus]AKK20078.1 hypothetical protein G293_02230 [Candidatus Liberibacter africanus PTSAPSY]
MSDKLDEVLRASKYFEKIVDEAGFVGIHKLEAINRGVTALTNFNPLKSMGIYTGTSGDEDGGSGDFITYFDRGGVWKGDTNA